MIIKQADDKQSDLNTLQGLLSHPQADTVTKNRIERERRNIQAGIRGEEEAAYEMKVHWGESKNWMVINDLRIEHNDLVAQIDHLIINRWLDIWVCESKHFSEGIAINEHGEFAAFFGNKPYGVPSPIEQNEKHILILQRLFDSGAFKLPTRLGFTIKPVLKSLVLVSKGARISRPKTKFDGLSCIIKNDQIFKILDKAVDNANLLLTAKIIGQDTLKEFAEEIAKHHKPIEFNWAAKFGLSDAVETPIPVSQTTKQAIQQTVQPVTEKPVNGEKPKQKLVCHTCGTSLTYNVAKFCWFNKSKFGGNIYCMDCQKKV
jgi:hypothetical protein